jgi:DNA (cytosine-5)-methyltransferase 1
MPTATVSPVRTSLPTAADLFCGAGGVSQAASEAGIAVALALNHNPTAVASHVANHPESQHAVVDISQADPNHYFATDLLLASPECTTYSTGRQPAAARAREAGGQALELDAEITLKSRATGFDVLRWLHAWRHPVAIVENVVLWRSWPLFDTVIHGLDRLGYDHQVTYRNAAIDGAACYRDRMFLVAWRRDLPAPDLTVRRTARCALHGEVQAIQRFTRSFEQARERVRSELAAGKRRSELFAYGRYGHDWRLVCPHCDEPATPELTPASAVLTDGVAAQAVFGRTERELTAGTVARLRRGLERHGRPTSEEPDTGTGRRQLIVLNYSPHGRVWPASSAPLNTVTGVDSHAVLDVERLSPGSVTTERDIDRLLAGASYRMLSVSELKRAMGFPLAYHLAGNDREQRIQIGMAVAPPTGRRLLTQVLDTLAARPLAA